MPRPQGTIYDRQNRVEGIHVPTTATIVGCGGTGFWTGVLAAMSGVEELVLIDDDIVERSNLNRLPVSAGNVRRTKIDVLSNFIWNLRGEVRIELHFRKLEKEEDCAILRTEVVYCCTDSFKSQQLICAYCKKHGLTYQRIGYDGTILNVSRSFPLTFSDDVPDGYEVQPSWVVPAVLAASAGISSTMYRKICLMDDIQNLHIQDCTNVSTQIKHQIQENTIEYVQKHIWDYLPEGYSRCADCSRVSGKDSREAQSKSFDEGVKYGVKQEKHESVKKINAAQIKSREEGYAAGYSDCEVNYKEVNSDIERTNEG